METLLENVAYIHDLNIDSEKIISYIEKINKKKNSLLLIPNRPHLTMSLYFEQMKDLMPEEKYIIDLMRSTHDIVKDTLKNIGVIDMSPRIRFAASKLMPGMDCLIHKDSDRSFAYQIYLNDNFGGGETFFPEQNIYIKPKPNHLVIFDSSIDHGVTKVENEPRYTIVSNFVPNLTNSEFVIYDVDDKAWDNREQVNSIEEYENPKQIIDL